MLFDAQDRAFALFEGECQRGIYDNMKTAVETIFVGKSRLYNRRLPADVQPLPRRPGRLHAGIGLGEGAGQTRSGWSASGSSRRGCGSRPTTR